MEFSWYFTKGIAKEGEREAILDFCVILGERRGRSPAIVTTRKRGLLGAGNGETGAGSGEPGDLNLSLRTGNDTKNVRRNRELLLRALGLRDDELARPEQVHGGLILVADAPGEYGDADGLVVSNPGLWTAILVADCVPVFVFSKDFSAVGLAHAGRKGTEAGITENLIKQVKCTFHLPSHELIVALGPSIGPCCYELDSATASQLPQRFIAERDGKIFFDLWNANAAQAAQEGIPRENIVMPPVCTCCREDLFFSHRAQRGKAGRQMAITRPGGIDVGGSASRAA